VLLTEAADPESLRSCCEAVLPKYWVPRRFVHTDRLPLTGTGKPARAEAARMVSDIL